MDQWINEVMRDTSAIAGTFNPYDVIAALVLSFLLSMLLAWTYKHTHRGLSYSVSFVHTQVILAVTVSLVMLIVGSNLARAFALVGALSIVRFRTAVKDPRDVAFIFMAMAVGMACGVRLYLYAMMFALFACPMVWFLQRFQIGAIATSEALLKVHLPASLDYQRAFEQVFARHLRESTLLSVEAIQQGALLELVYSVELKRGADERALLDDLRSVNGQNRAVLLTGAQNVTV